MRRSNQRRFPQRTQSNKNSKSPLVSMLDIRRLNYFRYDAKEILETSGVDQKVWAPLLASIVAKAGRSSIKDAQEYLHQMDEEKVLPKKTAEDLIRLLDKYKRFR